MALSDKSVWRNCPQPLVREKFYPAEKVQEFIQELKIEFCQQINMDCGSEECGTCDNCRKIDKHAGGNLL